MTEPVRMTGTARTPGSVHRRESGRAAEPIASAGSTTASPAENRGRTAETRADLTHSPGTAAFFGRNRNRDEIGAGAATSRIFRSPERNARWTRSQTGRTVSGAEQLVRTVHRKHLSASVAASLAMASSSGSRSSASSRPSVSDSARGGGRREGAPIEYFRPKKEASTAPVSVQDQTQEYTRDLQMEKMAELGSKLERFDVQKIVDKVYREIERRFRFDQHKRGF